MDEKAILIIQCLEWILNLINEEKDLEKVRRKIEWLRNEILYRGAIDFEWRVLEEY